jgi:hypothetical protein
VPAMTADAQILRNCRSGCAGFGAQVDRNAQMIIILAILGYQLGRHIPTRHI